MKTLVDCRYIRPGRPDGIGRFTAGLVSELALVTPVELLISDPRQLTGLPSVRSHVISAPTSWREPFVARQVNRIGADVVFSPMQTMGTLGRRYPLVLTVHDLIYYRHRTPPAWLSVAVRLLWRAYHLSWTPQRILLDRADVVATVSAATAALVAAHRLTGRPTAVVPDATDFHLPDGAAPRTRPADTARIVYVGSYMPYKDVGTLAAAVSRLPDHELHLVSPAPASVKADLRRRAGEGRLVFHDGLDDIDYRELLDGAVALCSASRDEGFGLPVLEAMARGTPVVLSDIPAFREVAAHAGTFVAPGDDEGFARAVDGLRDTQEWSERSKSARKVASGQTWERSATALLDALRAAVARDRRRRSRR